MGPVEWKDSYAIGDAEIDGHHQQLLRYARVLSDPVERAKMDERFLAQLVKGLQDYTQYHFAAEEQRMYESALPQAELDEHLAAHADFTKDVAVFAQVFERGSPRLERVLLLYLIDWVTNHILTADKRLGEHLKARGMLHTQPVTARRE